MYADSGIEWIDIIYNWCVLLLINLANQIGITYEEINVWLFVLRTYGFGAYSNCAAAARDARSLLYTFTYKINTR